MSSLRYSDDASDFVLCNPSLYFRNPVGKYLAIISISNRIRILIFLIFNAGRVLNWFSQDIGSMDEILPAGSFDVIVVST